jgi:hypothetical protein
MPAPAPPVELMPALALLPALVLAAPAEAPPGLVLPVHAASSAADQPRKDARASQREVTLGRKIIRRV